MGVEPKRFLSFDIYNEHAVIIALGQNGHLVIEAIGGKELFEEAEKQGLPIDRGELSGLAKILADAQRADVIDIGDTIPKPVMPEVGIAFINAIDMPELTPYFIKPQTSRRIARQEPPYVNPLLWSE